MAPLSYTVVNAFTDTPFKGNPAAVLVLHSPLLDSTLQNIATELNVPVTAFLTPIDVTKGRFSIRWFTVTMEVPLCGHATLASTRALLADEQMLPKNVQKIEFESKAAGLLTAEVLEDGRIQLEFPEGTPHSVNEARKAAIKEAINKAFGSNQAGVPIVKEIATGVGQPYWDYLIIEIEEQFDLAGATVDPEAFMVLAPESKVIMFTQITTNGSESFRTRVFIPASGIPDDPVTGSGHALLGPYWSAKLKIDIMVGRQVSKRTGLLGVELNREKKTVKLQGHGVIVAKGDMFLPD